MPRPVSWKTMVLLPPLLFCVSFGLVIPMVKSFTSCGCRSEPRAPQNLVSIYQSARSCGATIPRYSTLDELIDILAAGVTVDDCASPFYGKRFSIGEMNPQARADMLKYLRFDAGTGELDYIPPSEREDKTSCCD